MIDSILQRHWAVWEDETFPRVLHLGNQNAGIYMTKAKAAYWDGKDNAGEKVSSGVYFYTLQVEDSVRGVEHQQNSDEYRAGKFISTRRMVIVK